MASVLAPARMRLAGRACARVSPARHHQHQTQTPPQHGSTISGLQQPLSRRPFSSSTTRTYSSESLTSTNRLPPPPPSRWISDLQARIGRCAMFGCNPQQISDGAVVLRALATEWRELLAGSEGFLTGGRRGLDGREVAWGEMDSFGHVNNVTYYRYAESARVNWITNFAVHVDPAHRDEWRELMSPKATGLIMRSLKADFKFPMVYPDKISVYHRLRSRPEGDPAPSSFALDCVVLSHQHRRVACRLEEDIVVYDYKAGGKTSMPGYMVDLFQKTWREQEQETLRARSRIWELIRTVERLERETWNRPDAKEDMGGVKKT